MIFTNSERIFDTLLDTKKNYVSKMKTSFKIRKDVLSSGKHPIYIHITGGGKREYINTGLHVKAMYWIESKERVKPIDKEHEDINLILDKSQSKLYDIKISYRLNDLALTPEIMKREYFSNLNRINFVAFYEEALKLESKLSEGRKRVLESILNKLKEYNEYIPFYEIDHNWFQNYRLWLKNVKKNNSVTISTNIRALKKFLKIAQKSGIKLNFMLEDIKPGSTTGNRNFLNEQELKKALKYYFSEYINEHNKLVLGYFIFGCMTGLRISNIQKLRRSDFVNGELNIVIVKGNKDKILSINETAKRVISHCPNLFEKKYTNEELNRSIKKILSSIGIYKKISFHCARHTFATLILRSGGKIELLQQLLGHSSIKNTMIYSHIIQEEANKEVFKLDSLLE